MMPFRQKMPSFPILFNGTEVELYPVDLKNVAESTVVSSEFLNAIAAHSKPLIRAIAAEHENTSPEILEQLANDESIIVYFAALDNPRLPFKAALTRWHKILPEGTVWDSPACVDRHDELTEFLLQYNINVEDSKHIPARWIMKVIQDA